jgi:uncharacterized membrane protein YhaH (DUF805 family)
MQANDSAETGWWRWSGRLKRRNYAFWGLGLFFFKYNLDRLLAGTLFNKPWMPWSYLLPVGRTAAQWRWPDDRWLAFTLAITSLPFVTTGVLLTQRRLRDAGWPTWLTLLFFVPFVNLALFFALCLLPSRLEMPAEPSTPVGWWQRMFTFGSATASAAAAVALTVVLAVPLIALSTLVMKSYGWGVFVGVPFFSGFLGAVLHGMAAPRSWRQCCLVALLIVLITATLLVLLAVEGVICVLMAAPLALPLTLLGATAGYCVQHDLWMRRRRAAQLYVSAWALLPLLLAVERQVPFEPARYAVTTSVIINAPPELVWKHVVTFSELPPPTELVFRSGIAYPIRARIWGTGVGAVRHCEFSTGPFVEPITLWDEPHRLAFDVTDQPPPMRELSPYHALHPPHLDGFFLSRRGQFLLTPLPGGRTRLDGTTWYEQQLWPASYWRNWSDWLVHTIHQRVLLHIKSETETDTSHPS